MSLTLLILALGTVAFFLAVPVFEFCFGVLLSVSLLWFLSASVLTGFGIDPTSFGLSLGLAGGCFAAVFLTAYVLFGRRVTAPSYREYWSLLAFITVYSIAYCLCLLWPDFISMGERLRDYALLASTIKSPVIPLEPWMSGATLNYYVFWYRFAHLLSVILGLEVWEAYHVTASFALSFYAATIFQIVLVIFKRGAIVASFASIAIAFGSNVAGFLMWKSGETGWWGPSRVVKGAINEFPAWSFLLGDLHPHFLNLAAIPFAFLLLYRFAATQYSTALKAVNLAMLVVTTSLFLFASNAWEVPMWLGVVFTIVALSASIHWPAIIRWDRSVWAGRPAFDRVRAATCIGLLCAAGLIAVIKGDALSLPVRLVAVGAAVAFSVFCFRAESLAVLRSLRREPRIVSVIAIWIVLIIALKLSSLHIIPEGGSARAVRAPIEVTTTAEIFLHWGFPVTALSLGVVSLLPPALGTVLGAAFLAVSLAYDKGALFLMLLLGLLCAEWLYGRRRAEGARNGLRGIFGGALAIAAIALILVPEFVFLDDPYGGENERMNTIFKVYTTTWGLIGMGAMWIMSEVFSAIPEQNPRVATVKRAVTGTLMVPIMAALLAFFLCTIPLRRPGEHITPLTVEGLTEVNQRFPGSAAIIRVLRDLPRGVVLEGQGNAYDYTTFVTTLAAQPSYLGWSNHVNLLTRRYGDVTEREKTTESIYKETDCSKRRARALQAGIDYIVVGTREAERYSEVKQADFSCFKQLAHEQEYFLYAAK